MDSIKPLPQRNLRFDFARAICVLWIVGFWHLINYLPHEYRLNGNALVICKEITYGVLACFTFLSGYFLKKYEFNSINDATTFYKKRFIRFYPLFFVAAFCLLVSGSSFRQVLYAIVGLSLFMPHPIPTLWYFSMLLFFYLFTPLLKMKKIEKMKLVSLVVLIVLFFVGYFFADERFVLYLPFYVLGLNLPNRMVEKSLNIYTLFLSVAVFVGFYFIGSENLFLQFVQALAGVCAVLSFSGIVYNDKIQRPVAFIAEASMCAYLFHRPVYTVFTFVLGESKPIRYMPIYIAVIAVIALFITSFFIQKYYNRIINKINLKSGK